MAKRKGMDDIVEIDGKHYKVKVQHRKNSDGIDEPVEVYEEVDKKSYAEGGEIKVGDTVVYTDEAWKQRSYSSKRAKKNTKRH